MGLDERRGFSPTAVAGGAIRFAQDVTAVLRAALTLRDQKSGLTTRQFRGRAGRLARRLDHLSDRRRQLTDADLNKN